MFAVRSIITLLCAVGMYASVFMLRKTVLDARGRLSGPSVVQTARARLFAGVPNALIGIVYYAALLAVSWAPPSRTLLHAAFAASILAAGTSLYLAYSLLFVTRRPCLYCFLSHGVNIAIVAALAWLEVL